MISHLQVDRFDGSDYRRRPNANNRYRFAGGGLVSGNRHVDQVAVAAVYALSIEQFMMRQLIEEVCQR